jgi:hypothetical protein
MEVKQTGFALQVQTSWNQAHAPPPPSSRVFQWDQENDLKHPGSMDFIGWIMVHIKVSSESVSAPSTNNY